MIGNDSESSMSSHAGIGIRSTAAMHPMKKSAPQPTNDQSTASACQHSQQASGMIRTASSAVTAGPPVAWPARPFGLDGVAVGGGVRDLHQVTALVLTTRGWRRGIDATMNHAAPNCTHTSPTEMA